MLSLDVKQNGSGYINIHIIKSLSISVKNVLNHLNSDTKNRGTARCTCVKALLTVEAAVVIPFFVCFMVFILYFFRVLQVQTGVSQALQYAGRRVAAEYSGQAKNNVDLEKSETVKSDQIYGEECSSGTDARRDGATVLGMIRAKALFEKQLKKQKCPTQYISNGIAGISLMQSDFSGNYVVLKAIYKMKLPVALPGNIQYRIVQQVKCRKWIGYVIGQDMNNEDTWLYYTEHGTVYHASRTCTYLDLSIRATNYKQIGSSRNKNGGKYYKCERCESSAPNCTMVYITDYGDRYHSSLTCSGLKRSIYMIRKSKATEKRMCSKCGK